MGAQKKPENEEVKDPDQPIFAERLFSEDEDPATFKNQLIRMADSYGEEEHHKPFTEEEKARFDKIIVDCSLEIKNISDEKKAFNKEVDAQLKPLKNTLSEALKNKKSGAVWKKEVLYRQVDPHSNMVGIYDSNGILQRTEQLKRGRGLQKTIPLPTTKTSDEQ